MKVVLADNSNITEHSDLTIIQELANVSLSELSQAQFIIFPPRIKESSDLQEDNYLFINRNNHYYTSNVVGFLKKGDEEIEISTRFYKPEKQSEDYFLRYLIEKTLHYNVVQSELTTDFHASFYDLLVYLFPMYLNIALKKGPYKEYKTYHYNDANVKGTVDVARHIKQNIPFAGRVAYRTREFSYDNNLMQLIRHTIEKIERDYLFTYDEQSLNIENFRTIKKLTPAYQSLDREQIIIDNVLQPVRHAYYEEYAQLQRLCIRILREEQIGFGLDDTKTHGIIIDVAWLWEEYFASLLTEYQHPQFNESLYLNGSRGQVRPDFYHDEQSIVIDTKYKRVEKSIKREDRFQLISYLHYREAKRGGIIYPSTETQYQTEGHLKGLGGEVFKLSLGISQECDNYKKFSLEMEKNECLLIELLKK